MEHRHQALKSHDTNRISATTVDSQAMATTQDVKEEKFARD